jgi:hypothetical protein
MKPIHVIGITLATLFGIIWCVQIWSAGRWNTELQGEGNGSFFEQKRRRADAAAFVREAFNDGPMAVDNATDVSSSGPSREDRHENLIGYSLHALKGVGHRIFHRPRLASPGVYFTLTDLSVRTRYGITGVSAGTQVVSVKDEGPVLLVKAGDLEFEAKRQYLTNDLDIADLAGRNDAEAQQAVAAYIAQQQRAIDQGNDKRKVQPSGQQ